MQRITKRQQTEVLWDRQEADCLLWWRISPTLRCDCSCSYCAAEFRHRTDVKTLFRRRHLSPEQWVTICNKLDTGIIIIGGEPFVYIGLIDIVEQIDHPLRITSNLGPLTDKIIERLCKRGNIRMLTSYHHEQPGALTIEAFGRKVSMLAAGGLRCRINLVSRDAEHRKILKPIKRRFQKEFGIKDTNISKNARFYDAWPGTQAKGPNRTVLCQTGCLRLVGPDGFRYPCESKMVRGVGQMEDLLADDPTPMKYSTECKEFGLCLPCDRHGPRKIETVPEG